MSELKIRPWLSIWVKPRQTVRAIINYNVKYRFFALSFLYGLPTVLQMAQNFSLGGVFTLLAILLICVVLAPVLGAIGLLLCTLFLTWTGRWIGGKGSFLEVRCAVSWTNATNLLTVLIWAALIVQFRQIVFYEGFVDMPMTMSEAASLSIYFLIQFIVSIWSFILLLFGLSEAHGFSIWKALLNVVLAFVVGIGLSWAVLFVLERLVDVRV